MLLGCLFIPSFELGVNLIDYPKLLIDDVGPIALVDTDSELILDVTSLAKSAGVNPRQTYSQAFGLCPELKIIQINWAKTNEITESFVRFRIVRNIRIFVGFSINFSTQSPDTAILSLKM